LQLAEGWLRPPLCLCVLPSPYVASYRRQTLPVETVSVIANENLLRDLLALLESDPQQIAAHIRLWLSEEEEA
jgi:hypothetical protein